MSFNQNHRRCWFPAFPTSLSATACLLAVLLCRVTATAENWPMFRGPDGRAFADSPEVPTHWTAEENLLWSVELPGPGASSPIVWDDRVFITCYSGYGIDREQPGEMADLKKHLLCFNRSDGKLRWQQTIENSVEEDPYEGFITDHGYASSTPATDGEHVFVLFGKSGLHAFDMDGHLMWTAAIGDESDPARWGSGASPVLVGDLVIVNAGNEASAILAFRKSDGSEAWRFAEPKTKNSWSTPAVWQHQGQHQLIFSLPSKIIALNAASGEPVWFCESPIPETVIPSPIIVGDVVYSMGSRAGQAVAVRAGGSGDVTDSHIMWKQNLRAGISTPLILDDQMVWPSMGVMIRADAKTGSELGRERLQGEPEVGGRGPMNRTGSVYASPIAVGSRVYVLSRAGVMHVFETQPDFRKLATNAIEGDSGPFDSTPAVADNQLFFRSVNRLYCVQQQ